MPRSCCVVGRQSSDGAMLSVLLMIMFLHWCVGICVRDDYRSRCWFLCLSLLDGCMFCSLSSQLGGQRFWWWTSLHIQQCVSTVVCATYRTSVVLSANVGSEVTRTCVASEVLRTGLYSGFLVLPFLSKVEGFHQSCGIRGRIQLGAVRPALVSVSWHWAVSWVP